MEKYFGPSKVLPISSFVAIEELGDTLVDIIYQKYPEAASRLTFPLLSLPKPSFSEERSPKLIMCHDMMVCIAGF